MQNTSPQSLSLFKNHKAQITISKAWKKHKNLKTYKKCKENLPEYHESLKKWDTSIIQPVVTGIPLTPVRNDVLSNIPENLRKYYDIVSHDTFSYHLNKSWKKALYAIKDEEYRLLYVMEKDKIKSEHWIAGLLLQNNPTFQPFPPPKRQYSSRDKTTYDLDCSNVSPKVKHYVVVDDAAYTGVQMSINLYETIYQLRQAHTIPLEIHVVIPFISNNAKKEIEDLNEENLTNVFLYSSAQIQHIDKQKLLMTDAEKTDADSNELEYMTIFSHKQADYQSLGDAAKEHKGSVALYSKPKKRKTFIAYLEEQRNQQQS